MSAARAPARPARHRPGRSFAGIFFVTFCGLIAVGSVLPVLPRYVRGPLGENDLESVIATTRGGSVQLAEHATLFGLGQALAVGASVDASRIAFDASTRVGALDSQLQVVPGGPVIATAEGTAFAATPVGLGVRSRTLGAHASDAVTLTSVKRPSPRYRAPS